MTPFSTKFTREHPALIKYFYRILYAIGFLFVITISSSESPFAAAISITLILILMIPVVIIAFFQICYYGYGWLKHGNMFHDETRPYVYQTIVKNEVKARAWCSICKENTGCRVSRNPATGMVVHVYGGGSRTRKM